MPVCLSTSTSNASSPRRMTISAVRFGTCLRRLPFIAGFFRLDVAMNLLLSPGTRALSQRVL